jgi:hypothetical protein
MLDNHAGAKLGGFYGAHTFMRPEKGRRLPVQLIDISEIPDGSPKRQRVE